MLEGPGPESAGKDASGRGRDRDKCLFRAKLQVHVLDDGRPADGAGGGEAEGAGAGATVQLVGNISSSNCGVRLSFNASSMNFESYYRRAQSFYDCLLD
jgi:hypothetical protein